MTESLYLKIREERIKQGLSQKELGEMVGLPQQTINRIEQGQRKLDVELFEKLCHVLKIKKIGSFSVNLISSYYQTEPIEISENEQQQKEEAAKIAPKFFTHDKKGNIIDQKQAQEATQEAPDTIGKYNKDYMGYSQVYYTDEVIEPED